MLIKYSQIEGNLRRTASNGLISLLNHGQMEKLALDYFGIKNEYGDIIGYQCPYSGKIYTDYNDLVLEHIIPVISKGGSVLFNCIPTSEEVNKTSEKGAKHLISWWTNSKYWDKEAPIRLEKLVNYILDGYDKVFDEYTIEEVENSYLEIETNESILEEQDDNQYSSRKESQLLQKQSNENGIHSYLGFLLNCIQTLEKYNIDTTIIRQKLNKLQSKHIFEDIERFQLFQNILQQIVESRIGNDNRSTLTYVLNFNKKKLMDSISSNNPEEIYSEINLRLKNIENILKQNNLSIVEYFKSLGDISDIDIMYKNINSISEEEKNIFLENIKLGIDSKIDIFINVLNKGNSEILKARNSQTLEGYPDIKLSYFYSRYKEKIIKKLFEDLKDNPEYDTARRLIDTFVVSNSVDRQIPIFINMLNKGNVEILKRRNNQTLEGYPDVNLSYFYSSHKEKIIKRLFDDLKDNPEYDTARRLIDTFVVSNGVDRQISIFIDMLNEGNGTILKQRNNQTLKGYPSIKLSSFFNNHKEKIIKRLFDDLKGDPEYDTARTLVDTFVVSNSVDRQILIFIDMLNEGNGTILINKNNGYLKGYPSINLGGFWQHNKEKITNKLFIDLKDNPEYDTARRLVDIFVVSNSVDRQIPIFIDMLNEGNGTILKQGNNQTLKGYSSIKLSYFYSRYKEKIIKKLFEDLKDNPEYDTARMIVNNAEFMNNTDSKIDIFINMLNKGNSEILKAKNSQTLEGYPDIKLSSFFYNHKKKIIRRLFDDLKGDPEYDTARKLINECEFINNFDNKIDIFINMLNKGNSEILKARNNEILEGYPDIKLSSFFNIHKEKIIKRLFDDLKGNPEYDTARRLVDTFVVSNSVDRQILIFIDMLNEGNGTILKVKNNEILEGYPDIKLTYFYSSHKEKIIKRLFTELKDNPEYDVARQTVLTYLKVSSIEEYYEKESKSKELKELKKMKKILETAEQTLKEEATESRKRA